MTRSIYKDEMVALQDWLKSQHKLQNLTMHNLATRMARPHSFIYKVEQGERRLDVIEYIWYCTALGVDPHASLDAVLKKSSSPTESSFQE